MSTALVMHQTPAELSDLLTSHGLRLVAKPTEEKPVSKDELNQALLDTERELMFAKLQLQRLKPVLVRGDHRNALDEAMQHIDNVLAAVGEIEARL